MSPTAFAFIPPTSRLEPPSVGASHGGAAPRNRARRQPKILLVDDDAAVRISLARVLQLEGWVVITEPTGEAALECLATQQPDLVITDLCMKAVSGWDLLFHEHLERPRLPIIVITGLRPPASGGAEHLAVEFFQKPLDLEALIAAIHRRLNSSAPVSRS